MQPYHRDYPGQDAYYGGEKGRMTRVKRIANPAGFGAAILHTMQYWSDDQQALMPGFRDRIVELRQSPDEGGMNLTMDRRTVEILAAKGRTAARQIAPHPCRDSEGNEVSVGFDLEAHRTSRFSTAIGHLQMEVARLEGLYRPALPDGSPGYRSLMVSEPYASSMRRLAENVASSTGRPAPQWDPAAAVVTTDRLVDFATGGASDLSAFVDSPRGTVRVAPEV